MIRIARAQLVFLVILAALGGTAFGILLATPSPTSGSHVGTHHKSTAQIPDYTVAPCSLWADTGTPDLPPYTIQNVCAYQDASGAWVLSIAPDADLGQLPTR